MKAKPKDTFPEPEAAAWTQHSEQSPFWNEERPIEVDLVDGTREVWEKPDAKIYRARSQDVRKWRRVPAALWAKR